ncbi:Aldehyde oxidase and xanthine dehydrogenase, a/b hammerhead domain protein [Acididesulfobacillus acetoxydans]|uniref:Aldehyde oxidase and xanthine dehydrogenase, a/b hammerhead domain protein n=1 Tax=Acididesulfobacillus acetoxydans TaxID=1561005 RepID=A0A8S0W9Y3_9FIRM|nr:molybdopterin cofactor-binding domain-containing protein [Acididesulfobacillus acetoxydans]CAA7602979.1 Aldehyde oxidase and xanthine dehydrogenase, a/b hammerhead domain protein [Acididesulfobacillus acetoxydans]CEJ05861.1 Nicotinate dehydrogenase large molybdopterin subunit [Acididesulfobacillus acetoxydans]
MNDVIGGTVGGRVLREDAWGKVLGQAAFPADVRREGQIYAVAVRSPHAHARIRGLRLDEARKAEGVVAVLTSADVPHNGHGVLYRDQPVLVADHVRMAGDPVVLVGAETPAQARAAAGRVEVDYEVLPGLFDPEEAMKEEAPALHPEIHGGSNIVYHLPVYKGDTAKGWAEAEVTVERDYQTQMLDHAFLQPEAVLAYVDERGHLVVEVATQYAHYDRGEIAHALGLKFNQVRVRTRSVGGAFGGREDISLQIMAALMAWHTQRPVKMENTREESFYSHSKRHPMRMHYKTGATRAGKLTVMEARIVGDAGAYASWSPNILRKAAIHATGPYEIPHVRVDAYAVLTNNPYTGAMRGFGAAQPVLAYESQMDLLARELGLSPWEVRLRNIYRAGSETATGQVLSGSVGMEECLKAVKSYLGEVSGR